MDRHFKVSGVHIDGAREASIAVVPSAAGFVVEVRPKGGRKVYRVTLAEAAEMVAWRAAKREVRR
jgi:hypothetical protein